MRNHKKYLHFPFYQRFHDETTAIPRPTPLFSTATLRQGIGTSLTSTSPMPNHQDGMEDSNLTSPNKTIPQKSPSGSTHSTVDSSKKAKRNKEGM